MDWKKLVSDLEENGLTQAEIAELVSCSQPYVSQLKTGTRARPDFNTGNALVALHKKHAGKRQSKEARA